MRGPSSPRSRSCWRVSPLVRFALRGLYYPHNAKESSAAITPVSLAEPRLATSASPSARRGVAGEREPARGQARAGVLDGAAGRRAARADRNRALQALRQNKGGKRRSRLSLARRAACAIREGLRAASDSLRAARRRVRIECGVHLRLLG